MPPKCLELGARLGATLALLLAAGVVACDRDQKAAAGEPRGARGTSAVGSAAGKGSAAAAPASAAASAAVPAELVCPDGMALVPGGEFWAGSSPSERFSEDEMPRFRTRLAPFCLDVTEVTVASYARCVASGSCARAERASRLCNGGRPDRADHPINCVKYRDAEAYCGTRGARLPTEFEWEFAARGGGSQRYPWGDQSPDGRACWKHHGTCPVQSFAAGAFGIHDLSGNVWEWTESWYAPYPWPAETGYARVYRGGSFSRRFEKWMHTRLRNRAEPWDAGAHLGFRCALTPPGALCPFGKGDDGRCRHGVIERACVAGESWNGVRCAPPGAPRCKPGRIEKDGFGCVLPLDPPLPERDLAAEMRAVSRERTPSFDGDCQTNQRDRPLAFRYAGGSHDARNRVSRRDGCKNRDVGVGWNSTCCP